jgi:excisionase family DNA binding protein
MAQLLTLKELAEKLNIGYHKLWSISNEQNLPHIMLGKRKRFDYDEVIEFLKKNTAEQAETRLSS